MAAPGRQPEGFKARSGLHRQRRRFGIGALRPLLAVTATTLHFQPVEKTGRTQPRRPRRPTARTWARPGRRPPRATAKHVDDAGDVSFGGPTNAALAPIDAVRALVRSRGAAKAD